MPCAVPFVASIWRLPSVAARACLIRASGMTVTRWPAALARQPKSTSSLNSGRRGSYPPSSSQTVRRISDPAEPTAR
jgi:hypothetical protein